MHSCLLCQKNSGMPTYPYLYGDDLVNVLKKKHAAGTYKSLVTEQLFAHFCSVLLWCVKQWFLAVCVLSHFMQVFYLEACESGSIFEGLLPNDINVYATTASNADESSWGTYCPGEHPSPPPEYDTCLGDLYSIAWMEDRYLIFFYISFSLDFLTLKSCPDLVTPIHT